MLSARPIAQFPDDRLAFRLRVVMLSADNVSSCARGAVPTLSYVFFHYHRIGTGCNNEYPFNCLYLADIGCRSPCLAPK